jgi:hypothetical protein
LASIASLRAASSSSRRRWSTHPPSLSLGATLSLGPPSLSQPSGPPKLKTPSASMPRARAAACGACCFAAGWMSSTPRGGASGSGALRFRALPGDWLIGKYSCQKSAWINLQRVHRRVRSNESL